MKCQIVLGDCIEQLASLPDNSIDAIVTDPPFAMAGGLSNGRNSMADSQFFAHWWRAVCNELNRVLRPDGEGFIWCDWRTATLFADGFASKHHESTWRVAQMLYHYREMPGMGQPFRSSVDMIAYVRGPKSSGKRVPNTTHNLISKYWYYGRHQHHPAEKDAEICAQLIQWCSDVGMTVLDPFAGSGSVGVGCAMTGRQFLGFELDETYFNTARQRIAQAFSSFDGSWRPRPLSIPATTNMFDASSD